MLLKLLAIVSCVLLILGGSLYVISFDRLFYKTQFEKLQVGDSLGLTSDEAYQQFIPVLDYLEGNAEDTGSFYNDKEKAHFADVTNLYAKLRLLLFLSFAYLVWYSIQNSLRDIFFASSIFTLLFLAIFALIFMNFSEAFDIFHYILFDNDFWQMNLATDRIISLLPERIFFIQALRWCMGSVLVSFFLLTYTYTFKRR